MGDPLSLRGVFDIDRVETVLRSLSVRLDQQQAQLSALSSSAANCEQTCDILKTGIDRALLDIDRRFAQFDARLHRFECNDSRLDDIQRSVERLDRHQKDKADRDVVDDLTTEIKSEIERMQETIREFDEQKEVIIRLDSSQNQLAKQIAALQEMLSCKVDRVEVPLIQNAGERVKAAHQFRLEAGPKLQIIETTLNELHERVDSKEERSAIIERMQAIYREFQNRPDKDFIEEKIERPLEDLRQRLQSFESLVSSLEPQAIMESLQKSRSDAKETAEEIGSLKSQLDRFSFQLSSRASVRLLEKKADKSYCEQLIHELALNWEEKIGSHAAVVDGVRKQILELKRIQNEVDGKLSVSLKFLDWFSTVQLEKQIGSRTL